jgi:hypothetical protein
MTRLLQAIDTAWLQWALRSMHPLHPELPMVVRQLNASRPL